MHRRKPSRFCGMPRVVPARSLAPKKRQHRFRSGRARHGRSNGNVDERHRAGVGPVRIEDRGRPRRPRCTGAERTPEAGLSGNPLPEHARGSRPSAGATQVPGSGRASVGSHGQGLRRVAAPVWGGGRCRGRNGRQAVTTRRPKPSCFCGMSRGAPARRHDSRPRLPRFRPGRARRGHSNGNVDEQHLAVPLPWAAHLRRASVHADGGAAAAAPWVGRTCPRAPRLGADTARACTRTGASSTRRAPPRARRCRALASAPSLAAARHVGAARPLLRAHPPSRTVAPAPRAARQAPTPGAPPPWWSSRRGPRASGARAIPRLGRAPPRASRRRDTRGPSVAQNNAQGLR
jgi:hypothetical protein